MTIDIKGFGRQDLGTGVITDTELAADSVGASQIKADAVGSSELAADSVGSSEIAADAVGSSEVAADAIGGSELNKNALRFLPFTGRNGAGACTATGLRVGDKVIGALNITSAVDQTGSFEGTITVNDQIQQTSATNLSTEKYALLVVAKS